MVVCVWCVVVCVCVGLCVRGGHSGDGTYSKSVSLKRHGNLWKCPDLILPAGRGWAGLVMGGGHVRWCLGLFSWMVKRS